MRAIVHTKYGSADELQIQEIEKPTPKDDEVLIKIHSTTVTTTDCNARNFTFVPKLFLFMARIIFGFKKPKINILGVDLAGEIEAVGKEVNLFKVGDQVFGSPGDSFGAYAEYICIPMNGAIAIKPPDISWEEAASIPLAGNTALFFIRDLGKIQKNQKILINGASGGIGTFAVQLAKYYGANVTGVCSTKNLEFVKNLGADNVIDYTQEDFSQRNEKYDIVFDVVGKTSFTKCKHLLNKKGTYLINLVESSDILPMLTAAIFGGKKIKGGSAKMTKENIEFLKQIVESGKLLSIIDKIYPFEEIVAAFKHVEKGHKKGTVVINVENNV